MVSVVSAHKKFKLNDSKVSESLDFHILNIY